jgi:superfamily II DNA or RNA helicase
VTASPPPASGDYSAFVASKLSRALPTGIHRDALPPLSDGLFAFQADLTRWALRRGRAAIFADTGLGKARMGIEWARVVAEHTWRPVLILAPLAVAAQTAAEGRKIGVTVVACRSQSDVANGATATGATVFVTNYERLHKFDPSAFGGVVLDESSCIKHHDTKTLKILMAAFSATPFRLCLTATPSPNDYTELGTHAEFLGICSRAEMLAEFFVHDGGDTSSWRLKGHARNAFWRFVATWGAMIRKPSDLGYPDDGYILPALTVHHHVIPADQSEAARAGLLFVKEASTLSERRTARRASLDSRVRMCVERVNAERAEPWVVWCDLNDESEALTEAIEGAVEVRGAQPIDEKERRLTSFSEGRRRAIVSKPSICGWGLNWQHCARMAFVGVTDSWEAYYQALRRIHRFGQRRPCHVHIFTSELEGAVVANLKRKEGDAARMAEELSAETRAAVLEEVTGQKRVTNDYAPVKRMVVPSWLRSA